MNNDNFNRAELLLQDLIYPEFPDLSLASGVSGILVMQTALYQLERNEPRRICIEKLVSILVDQIPQQNLLPGLWSGIAGVLYALEFVRHVNPFLLGDHVEDIDQFVVEMDSTLISYLACSAGRSNFDLVSGISGIGAYALIRTDKVAGRQLFYAVESALLEIAEYSQDMITWRTPGNLVPVNGTQEERRFGRYDLGIAHGVSGVIGLLALAMQEELSSSRSPTLLKKAVKWLLANEDRSIKYSRFASVISTENDHSRFTPPSSRLAWCYGDLGISSVLAKAAEVLMDLNLEEKWKDILENRLKQPESSFLLDDFGLCHGTSGAFHILSRLSSKAEISVACNLQSALSKQLDYSLDKDFEKFPIGLLEGRAGLLLAKMESDMCPVKDIKSWDFCFLTAN